MNLFIAFLKKIKRTLSRVSNTIKKSLTIKFSRVSSNNVKIHSSVRFNQKVVLYGKGKLSIGENTNIGIKTGGRYKSTYCELQPRRIDSQILIGKNVEINNGMIIIAAKKVEIGDNCLIGRNLQISDYDAHSLNPSERKTKTGKTASVSIGKNVWIGNDVTILKGVTIGDNCVIGAKTLLLTGNYPSNSVIVGIPARIAKIITE